LLSSSNVVAAGFDATTGIYIHSSELGDRQFVHPVCVELCDGSCLENREYCRRDPSRLPRGILYPQKLEITSPTSGGRSVGIVRSRTQTMEFSLVLVELCEQEHNLAACHTSEDRLCGLVVRVPGY
jgi:hypothetical protein